MNSACDHVSKQKSTCSFRAKKARERERNKAVKIRNENMNEYSCVKKRHRQDKTMK